MDQIIETERLVLRPLVQSDAVEIAEKINHYEIAGKLARVPFPYHLADAVEFLAWVKTLDEKSCFYSIRLRHAPDVLVGSISVEWNESKLNGEIGYWLVQEHWGKSLMSEAVEAVIAEAFQNRGIGKIVSCFFNENPASGKVLAKAGFEVTGHCEMHSRAQGQDVPVTTVSLTKSQWLLKNPSHVFAHQ